MSPSQKHRPTLCLSPAANKTSSKQRLDAPKLVARTDYPHFEQRLRERWSLLRDEIHATLLRADAERYADIAGQVHDTKDLSLSYLLADVSHAEVLRDAEEVHDIEAALKRIDAGTYGVCIRCHSAIGRKRLEAYPSAKRCLTCQKAHERPQIQSSRTSFRRMSP